LWGGVAKCRFIRLYSSLFKLFLVSFHLNHFFILHYSKSKQIRGFFSASIYYHIPLHFGCPKPVLIRLQCSQINLFHYKFYPHYNNHTPLYLPLYIPTNYESIWHFIPTHIFSFTIIPSLLLLWWKICCLEWNIRYLCNWLVSIMIVFETIWLMIVT
jgi:hypothetical protein